MKNFYRNTFAKINVSNYRHNIRVLKKIIGEKNYFCGMVKANAYGHGDVEISKALLNEGVTSLGVALIEEGVRLREAGIKNCKILVFCPHMDLDAVKVFLNYELTPVVSSWRSLIAVQQASLEKKISIHLKINTGMNRLGFAASEIMSICEFLRRHSNIILEGLCTHFLMGEDWGAESSQTKAQLHKFSQVCKAFSGTNVLFHAYNSAALVAGYCNKLLSTNQLGARPGLSLYGVKPKINFVNSEIQKLWSEIDLKPVLSLHSEVALVQTVLRGEPISYEAKFICHRDSKIGVLPIGYADGFRRHFSNNSKVLLRDQIAPVVGTVCMDSTMIDLTNIVQNADDGIGQEAVLIGAQGGHQINVEELAEAIKTNAYEIFTGISERVPRVYI